MGVLSLAIKDGKEMASKGMGARFGTVRMQPPPLGCCDTRTVETKATRAGICLVLYKRNRGNNLHLPLQQ